MICAKCGGTGLISSYEVCSVCNGLGHDGTEPVETTVLSDKPKPKKESVVSKVKKAIKKKK